MEKELFKLSWLKHRNIKTQEMTTAISFFIFLWLKWGASYSSWDVSEIKTFKTNRWPIIILDQ